MIYARFFFEACPWLESLRFAFTFLDFRGNLEETIHLNPLAPLALLLESIAIPPNFSLERRLFMFSIFASCCLRDFDTPRILAV